MLIGLLFAAFVFMLVFKLLDLIAVGWLMVFAPLLVSIALVAIPVIVIAVGGIIYILFSSRR